MISISATTPSRIPLGLSAVVAAVVLSTAQAQTPDPASGATGGPDLAPLLAPAAGTNAIDFIEFSGSCGANQGQNIGWQFDVTNAVTVTAMSWYDQDQNGLELQHEVGIFDPSGALITSTNVVIPAGTAATLDGIWRTVSIPPTLLPPGTGYIVGGYNGAHSECLNFNVTQTVHPDLVYFDATYSAFTSTFGRPANYSGAINGFYGVGFQVGTGQVGTAYCFCDANNPSGNVPPCGNYNDGSDPEGAGCQHDDSAAGARLYANGQASISGDTLVLYGVRGPISNSTLFFQANNNLDGAGNYLGDGIRCTGGGLIRIQPRAADANGDANTTIGISAKTGVGAGETKYYQWWFRDPGGSPCGTESNTSNGLEITWTP